MKNKYFAVYDKDSCEEALQLKHSWELQRVLSCASQIVWEFNNTKGPLEKKQIEHLVAQLEHDLNSMRGKL